MSNKKPKISNYSVRECKSFDPTLHIVTEKKEDGKISTYLPAYARILWFNAYNSENDNKFSLTCQIVSNDKVNNLVTCRASLTQLVDTPNGTIPFEISSGIGTFVVPNNEFVTEKAETRALARCLRTAGFNIQCENGDEFNEGTIVDAPIPVLKPDKVKKTEPEKKARNKKTVEKSEEMVSQVKDIAEQTQMSLEEPNNAVENTEEAPLFNSIPSLDSLFPTLKNDDATTSSKFDFNALSDKEKLHYCLYDCFYPWATREFSKGDLIKDICLNPAFSAKLRWILEEYTGKEEIAEGLSISEWAKTLAKYLIDSSVQDKQLLLEVLSEE